jgi:hypothetical protein
MKFLQTSRGCRVTFEDGEEFAGKELSCSGQRYFAGYSLDSNNMSWRIEENGTVKGVPISLEEKDKLIPLVVSGGKKQGILIEFRGVNICLT